jgi:hypothetical protein
MRREMTRRGVRIRDLGSHETRNGIAWAAEVDFGGMAWRVENAGNGGMTLWTRREDGVHGFAGERETFAGIARLARTEPCLAEYAETMDDDRRAAGMFISAALDGCFLVTEAR